MICEAQINLIESEKYEEIKGQELKQMSNHLKEFHSVYYGESNEGVEESRPFFYAEKLLTTLNLTLKKLLEPF